MTFEKFAKDAIEPEQVVYSLLTRYQNWPQDISAGPSAEINVQKQKAYREQQEMRLGNRKGHGRSRLRCPIGIILSIE